MQWAPSEWRFRPHSESGDYTISASPHDVAGECFPITSCLADRYRPPVPRRRGRERLAARSGAHGAKTPSRAIAIGNGSGSSSPGERSALRQDPGRADRWRSHRPFARGPARGRTRPRDAPQPLSGHAAEECCREVLRQRRFTFGAHFLFSAPRHAQAQQEEHQKKQQGCDAFCFETGNDGIRAHRYHIDPIRQV